MFVNQVACIVIILGTGAGLFFNLFCTSVAEIWKVEPCYEAM